MAIGAGEKIQMKSQLIHFDQMTVRVSQNFIGEWEAYDDDTYDCDCDQDGFFTTCPIGRGDTMMAAIADLVQAIRDRE